ncbi:homer protein homolog 1-like isoform X2 [Babylonia areolata]|uniref:homer protein homolog 1-like isoform X2 n=1 Tax=Babylonia areolata TaxID=304850 RepID=UPI003FD37DB8
MSDGEQPIFSTKAHVFQIDPETKKNWLPASKAAVNVSYYYDSTRSTYRIISVDGSKAIINSTITPNMTFTKTSNKFGQWSDARANTVYGLGFPSESELTKFIEKFKEIKEMTRRSVASSKPSAELNGTVEAHGSPQPSPARSTLHQRTNSLSSIQTDTNNLRERRNSFTQGSNGVNSAPSPNEAQLKYENDRLKLALAQSSANAKKWEVELTTLKNNNARLTAALQESTANVEEWKKQLATYKEENARLRKKAAEKEHEGGLADASSQLLQQEMQALSEEASRYRQDNRSQLQEISQLRKQLEEVSVRETQIPTFQRRIQDLEEENHSLGVRVQDLQRQLQDSRTGRENESREVLALQEKLGSKITDIYYTLKVKLQRQCAAMSVQDPTASPSFRPTT